jgi:hypothetical protein
MSLLPVLTPAAPAREALVRSVDSKEIPPDLGAVASIGAVTHLMGDNPRLLVKLIAGWLSTREAIWWSCLCQSQLLKVKEIPGPLDRLKAVVNWVKEPTDANRDAVGKPGDGDSSPVGMLSEAVAFCTTNISPAKDHPVPCPPGVVHKMVALSILTAANQWPGPNRKECLHHFIELGLDVAEGKHLWAEGAIPKHPGLRGNETPIPGMRGSGNIWEKW